MHFAYLQEPCSWYEHSQEVLREGGKEDIYSCLFLKFLLFLGHVDEVESIQYLCTFLEQPCFICHTERFKVVSFSFQRN